MKKSGLQRRWRMPVGPLSIVLIPPQTICLKTLALCAFEHQLSKNRIMWDDIEFITEEEYKQRIQRKKRRKVMSFIPVKVRY